MGTEKNRRKREKRKYKRRENIQAAKTDGWKKCSEYHFQKNIGGKLVNWWPSNNK